MILDDDEKLLQAGDVLVQRDTNHVWANCSCEQCAVLFVLIDASPIEGPPPPQELTVSAIQALQGDEPRSQTGAPWNLGPVEMKIH
ncbi:hypothetical protein SAMN04487926_119137 [Paraburkholderia steynii]|uniref:Uncharacterized protein n=1 Tax=Paraburkholderia steynii TaxID=1245441 RepID=A0A7Z7BBJ5_9BURK|nr:hypothetical protein SAMN04487926_119137 [Paraburkholderia steynii]